MLLIISALFSTEAKEELGILFNTALQAATVNQAEPPWQIQNDTPDSL